MKLNTPSYAYLTYLRRLVVLGFCFLLLPMQSFAHPHVWVETSLKLLVNNGEITGIRVNWVFDELYSASFLLSADTNKNKKLEKAEAAHTVKTVFVDGQQRLHPFMHIVLNGSKTPFTLQNAQIWMEKDDLNYQFDISLSTPQPINGQHEIGIYDPEFYVSFEQMPNIELPADVSCTQKLAENRNISIYFDMVNPETYALTCK